MVCMDGFILTHAYERVDMPTQEQVDAYLPPYEPRQVLDPADPVSIGAMVGPEAFMEVRYLAHAKQRQALELIPAWASEFQRIFGRESGGLTRGYRIEDAETVVVALGSVLGTIKDTVDEMRERGQRIGVLGISCFRPWPSAAVRAALSKARRVVVLEKSLAVGLGGIIANNVAASYPGSPDDVHTVIAGLGGRSITRSSLQKVFAQAIAGRLEPVTFLDLDYTMVDRVLQREREQRRSGPIAEAILREIGVVAAKIG
jgi:pyruvate ferredoxin oxidoreductase alpha subunit